MGNPVTNLQRTAARYREMDSKDRRRFWTDGILNNALYILMIVFIVYTAIKKESFLGVGSIANIITQVAAYLPMALGIGGCIVLTGTDLSAGRILGLCAATSAAILQKPDVSRRMLAGFPVMSPAMAIVVAILVAMAVGSLIGFVNGFFVAKFKLHPFIVTLATQLITYSIILLFFSSNGNNGAPISGAMPEYTAFVTGTMISLGKNANIPWLALYSAIFVVIMWFIWNKTTFGKNMFAVGSNAEAANVSGVNVFKTTVLVHTLAGLMYGLAGFLEAPRIGSVQQNTGLNYECDAIAACVIGGVSFVGGSGKISGIVLGVFVLRLIFVALTTLGIDPNLQYIIKGGIILIAVSLDMRKYLVKK